MEFADDAAIDSFKVPDLKHYLRKFGQNVSGKKNDLVLRAKGVKVLGLQSIETVHSNDQKSLETRRKQKLLTPLDEVVPDPLTLKGWSEDLAEIPNFTDADVYKYLVLTMKAKRQMKSRVFFEDRHVHELRFHPVCEDCSHCLVKCKVIPSLPSSNKKENPDYVVWVLMSKVTGNIHSADCNCTAGLGEACNHIGALLHALVDVTERKKDGLLASTSNKCAWNNPRKRKLSPKKACELFPRKAVPDNHTEQFEPTVDEQRFRQKLLSFQSKAGWFTNFEKENATQPNDNHCALVNKISTGVSFMYHDSKDISSDDAVSEFTNYFSKIEMSDKECEIIERETQGQVGNSLWTLQRHGRITSSNFGHVHFRKETTPPDGLIKRLFQYTTFDNKYVRWGRTHEPAARRMYQNAHKEACVQQCGLIINPAYPHLGASPDGLVFDPRNKDPYGTLEIKCPASSSWKNLSPSECAKDPEFFCEIDQDTGAITLKHNHVYYCQVQGQLAITGRKWCDFVVWTLKRPFSVERIYFDHDFWRSMLKKLNKFYIRGVLPELFTSRVQRGIPLYKKY